MTMMYRFTKPALLTPYFSKYRELDFVNMMQYDFHGAWDSTTGLQAALFKHSSETNPDYSIDDTVKTWMKAGCEADKLVIGK